MSWSICLTLTLAQWLALPDDAACVLDWFAAWAPLAEVWVP